MAVFSTIYVRVTDAQYEPKTLFDMVVGIVGSSTGDGLIIVPSRRPAGRNHE